MGNTKEKNSLIKDFKDRFLTGQRSLFSSPIVSTYVKLILKIIVLLILLIVSFRNDTIGILIHNLLSYLLSDLYIIPVVSLLAYYLYAAIKKRLWFFKIVC